MLKATVVETFRQQVALWLITLQTWPWIDTVRTLRQRFREDRLGLTASSLTFTTLISLVPLFTVMLAVFSAFPMFSNFQGALEKYFLQALVPDGIAKPVLAALTQFSGKAKRLGAVGLIVLVVTALALMLTIDRTLNAIWRVRNSRPIAQRVLVYWAATTLGPLLLGVSLTMTSYAISASRGFVGDLPGGVSVLLQTVEFALQALGMAALFFYVPNTHVRWRHALAGGVFVAVGFEFAKRALGWYLQLVPSYSTIYGAFATVPIFLVWLYLGWVIVLLGAVIAAYAPTLQLRVVQRSHVPGYRFELAVSVLRSLAAAHQSDGRGLSVSQIAEVLNTDPLQVEPIVDTLVAIDWVGRLDEPGGARHVMLCDPANTAARALMAATLLDPSPQLAAFWQRAHFDRMTVRDLIVN
ncbi:MAG: YihY family inner membrane protein [Pseudomonadota bacterium]|nr:YihY family inner membrane protein [Pseudomonadota bacterium]